MGLSNTEILLIKKTLKTTTTENLKNNLPHFGINVLISLKNICNSRHVPYATGQTPKYYASYTESSQLLTQIFFFPFQKWGGLLYIF